jgi:hypothetical protein
MTSRSNEPIPRLRQIAGQAIPCVNGITGDVSAAAGRKGFKAEIGDLRERMRGLGFGHDEIAAELARRYRVRPRESYRLAHGWSCDRVPVASLPHDGQPRGHVVAPTRTTEGVRT